MVAEGASSHADADDVATVFACSTGSPHASNKPVDFEAGVVDVSPHTLWELEAASALKAVFVSSDNLHISPLVLDNSSPTSAASSQMFAFFSFTSPVLP
jgi:hypothetical protein